jgi:hypothetical protein
MMVASHSRMILRDRGYRQPKHALPSAGRTQRTGIRSLKSRRRHAANAAAPSYAVAGRTSNLWATPQRVIRRVRLERISHPILVFGTVSASAARYLVGAGRHGALFIVFSVCATCASGAIAAPHIWSTGRPQMPAADHSAHPSPKPGLIPPIPQHDSVRQAPTVDGAHPVAAPPTSNAPRVVSPPPVREVQSMPAAPRQSDPARDVQDLPSAQADPELEAALSDLDKQAELDESIRRQLAPGQQPPVAANAGPSPALPAGPPLNPSRTGHSPLRAK